MEKHDMTMFPSACVWVFKSPIDVVLRQIKEAAFHYVDIRSETLDAPGAMDALKNLGLKVSCVELDDTGSSLDGKIRQRLDKAHSVGARYSYIRPCTSAKQLKAFSTAAADYASYAAEKGIKLCIEHVPGTALPTVKATLAFVQQVNHPNLYLLLDVGHALLSKEKPWEAVAAAGDRLGYVQMSDNDGKSDRHWALLDGRLSGEDLAKILEALMQAGYQGTLGLQLSEKLRILPADFSRNRNLLLRMQMTTEPKSFKEPESRRKQ
jgi:sugar phosphate isomerase/epimerase